MPVNTGTLRDVSTKGSVGQFCSWPNHRQRQPHNLLVGYQEKSQDVQRLQKFCLWTKTSTLG